VLPVFQILTLLKLLILALAGKSRNIISNGSFWLILYLFSIHQINMYRPSTSAPKPCSILVQKAGPKTWTIFRQKWLKKIVTLLGGKPKQTDSQITSCFVNRVPVPPTAFSVWPFFFTVSYTGKLLLHSIAKFNITVARNL